MPSIAKMRVAVVGAGIVGASIAYRLASRGAAVQLFDENPAAGRGVTSRAFGWVNMINGSPGDATYRLRQEAVAEYQRVKTILPQALSGARPGSLVWEDTAEETAARAAAHRAKGSKVELVDAKTIAGYEPSLRAAPDVAAFSPDDLAIDSVLLAETFASAAVAAGAEANMGEKVVAIETMGCRVTGVRTTGRLLSADIVVLANGGAVDALAADAGLETGVGTSPAILLQYSAPHPFLTRIVCGPTLEIRQAADNALFVAESYIDCSEENAPAEIGRRTLETMKRELVLPDGVELIRSGVGQRPIFADGFPRLGFAPSMERLYVAVGHPGVILAPLLGRLAMEEIAEGQFSALIPRLRVPA